MRKNIILFLFLLFSWTSVLALEPPPLEDRVMDLAGLLSGAEAEALIQQLQAHEKATTQQFAVLTIPSLEGDPIEDFSIRTVEAWKLGTKEEDNGLLLLVAKEDRKMRIEVGYGLEGEITDLLAGRIISDVMQPAFRNGDFAGGIQSAVTLLIAAANGEEVDLPESSGEGDPSDDVFFWLTFALFIGVPMVFGSNKKGRGGRRSRGFSGGGFSSGGGGGFSGGGGSFGGGGSSGGW